MQDAVGVDLELHPHPRRPARPRREIEVEAAQRPIVRRAFAFALDDVDAHRALARDGVGEHLARFRGDRGVARDDDVGQAAERLDAQGQRRHVEQDHVEHRAGKDAGLDRRAERHGLIGVLRGVGFPAENLRDQRAHERHPRGPADEDDGVEFAGGKFGVGEGAQAVGAGAFDDGTGE